ncbi:hypothetical protein RAC79_21815 [Agrobacterium sp. LR_9]|uniref:hypothetical protein n=1 Tax=Agrobacterium sp. LR_9 TaxID=3055787 RepID=UPI0035C25715
MTWWQAIPLREAAKVEVSKLSFDQSNPRYSSDKGMPHETDEDIVTFLNETSDLGELLQSISTSGYVDIEPLIVLGQDEKLIVLEGNRRLAALRVLSDPTLAARCGINAPPVAPDKVDTLKAVTVYRVPDRGEARDFIGFKHINGAHRWDSIAKARYAADWLDEERAKGDQGLSLQEIARRMGDRHSTLQRMVSGYYVLEQAENKGLFSVEDREPGKQFAFSHLYTALTRPGYRRYLGLAEESRASEPTKNPIGEEYLANLRQVMLWLYGSDSDTVPAVIRSQNPHIKQLGEILDNPKARKIMLESNDLPRAYSEVESPQRQFERRLVEAHGAIEESLKKASAFDGKDATLLEIADEIQKNARNLVLIMKAAGGATE